MRIDYNQNFPREIDRQVEHREGKVRIAEEVVKVAKSISPERTGAYKGSLGVHLVGPAVYVRATDWKGHFIEWGTNGPGRRRTPTFAPIRRAVLQTGLRLDEAERNRAS